MGCTVLGHVDADEHRRVLARIAVLERALLDLTNACITEFGDGTEPPPFEPDESSVFAGVPDGGGITFGHLRRARAALESE